MRKQPLALIGLSDQTCSEDLWYRALAINPQSPIPDFAGDCIRLAEAGTGTGTSSR